jgi:hypothetical protein
VSVVKKQAGKYQNANPERVFHCRNCGIEHRIRECPAFNKKCNCCGKLNHFARCCRNYKKSEQNKTTDNNKGKSKKKYKSDTVDCEDSSTDEEVSNLHIGSLISGSESSDWYEEICINGEPIQFKLDTGAQCNVVSFKIVEKLNIKLSKSKTRNIISYNNQKTPVMGEIHVFAQVKSTKVKKKITIKVVDMNVASILGKASCVELQLVKRVNALDEENIYEGLGCLKTFIYRLEFKKNPYLTSHQLE